MPKEENLYKMEVSLENALIVKEWCLKNGKLPKGTGTVYSYPRNEEEEQLYLLLEFIKKTIKQLYENEINFKSQSYKNDMEVFSIIIELENRFNSKSKFKLYEDARVLKKWSDKTGLKPEKTEIKDETAKDNLEELKMYKALIRLRCNLIDGKIPKEKQFFIKYVLNEVNSRSSKNDEHYIDYLKSKLNAEEIRLNPIQIEVLRAVEEGQAIGRIAKKSGLDIEKTYYFLHEFCKKYACRIVNSKRGTKGSRKIVLEDKSIDIDLDER